MNKKNRNKRNNRIGKKIISVLLVIVMILAVTPLDGVYEELFGTNPEDDRTADSLEIVCAATPDDYPGHTQRFDTTQSFVDFCALYRSNSTFASEHQNDELRIVMGADAAAVKGVLGSDFVGLGTLAHPFGGTVKIADNSQGSFVFTNDGDSFFYCVYDSVHIISDQTGQDITLVIKRTAEELESGKNFPVFAQYVDHLNNTTSATWNVQIAADSTGEYSGAIGAILSDATVDLVFSDLSTGTNVVSRAAVDSANYVADVGSVCGRIEDAATLNMTFSEASSSYSITSENGNAGGFVGTMNGTATLNIKNMPAASASKSVISNGTAEGSGFAGGLVGKITSTATVGLTSDGKVNNVAATVIPVKGSVISAENGAGGLFGYYDNVTASNSFDVAAYSNTATVYGMYGGGLFGVLEHNKAGNPATANTFTITDSATTNFKATSGSGDKDTTAYFGGLIGRYKTDDLKNSLIIQSISFSAESKDSFASFGGAIGIVDSAAYVKADGVSITAKGTAKRSGTAATSCDYFGGLIGKTSDMYGVFVDLGDFTLSAGSESYKGGGVVGGFENGVLRLSGTTDLSSAKSQKGGQLVGANNNVLVYALGTGINGTAYGTGWTLKRSDSSQVDDLGTWGEVVRFSDIEHTTDGILTLDSTNHTVTIKAAVTSMGTQAALVKTALNIQLNNKAGGYDCLLFTPGEENTRASLLGTTLAFTADLTFVGTGITGLMRDGSDSVGAFTGTLNGGSKTITLSIGEKYGKDSSGNNITSSTSGEGLGQIYGHPYNGLFAVIGNGAESTGTVNSLTINGTIDVHNKIDGMNIGGIAAVSKGNTTLNGITANQTVEYNEPTAVSGNEATGKNIGGLIGIANGSDNGTIAVTGTNTISTAINISDNFKSWTHVGAAIGKITSPKFTVNIAQGASDKLTVSHTMSVATGTVASTNADGGGLIGYITSGTYTDRKVNIKNLDFNNCTIVNTANTNGGGFLGYAWLDTDTTIDGLTVTNGTITNSSLNVGVMCYEATGRWRVNNLTVTKMSLSAGAGTSLGMLVNKAYSGNNGLYLDVLKAGYMLTNSGITLPGTLGVFDEIAAYSASKVIEGGNGAGVISINMNNGRHNPAADPADSYTSKVKITETGTYQNQISRTAGEGVSAIDSAKYPNANTRYYYNLDQMSSSDVGQNIVLWSVNKYAASNISGLFTTSVANNTLTGAANMTGLSFYPLYSMPKGTTLNGLTLTMDYSGVYNNAETTFNTTYNNTDSYVRDPGASNQHYLMQSGLFITQPEGTNLSIKGTNTLSGTFLQLAANAGDYNGLLVSKKSNGSLTSASGSQIILAGITPKTTGNASYDDGYLLVNKIEREDNNKSSVSVYLEGISTTSAYSSNGSTATVAKSLIGDIAGPAIDVEFSKIKLDSRTTGTLSTVTALKNAYGTENSIFTDSTLLASLKTTSNAQLRYYYTYDEDWGGSGSRWVTYGQEVENSIEYPQKEEKYYGSEYYTDPVSSAHSTDPVYPFATGFLRYVKHTYDNSNPDANGSYYRELKVNVMSVGLTDGCGTYNDPYIISNGGQLESVATLLNSSKATDLEHIRLPITEKSGIEANSTGNRWCDNDHADFTGSASTYTCDSDPSKTWTLGNVKLYLAGAYYKIGSNATITLTKDFQGLGGTDSTGKFAFRGVIVGSTTNGVPNCTIENSSKKPFINVANGLSV